MNTENELLLIPKYEKFIEYMLQVILKMPRTEKFNIGNEFKCIMYKMLENILYINKIEIPKRLYYLNLIDAEANMQRVMLRIMVKNKWIDEKKYKVSMEMLYCTSYSQIPIRDVSFWGIWSQGGICPFWEV